MLSLESIGRARRVLQGRLRRTPLVASRSLSERLGAPAFLKLECLQTTGSFKPRGAFNKMLALNADERRRGVIAVSGGNHAQGVAFAARTLGVPATLLMPRTTPSNYLSATRDYGAQIVLTPDIHAAFAAVPDYQARGLTLVHPFDDPLVAAGQGTIGLEILDDLPDVTHVFVSIGGGGLIAGVATALKTIKPDVRVIGVETAGADVMARSLAAGRLVDLPQITSIARTLGSPRACDLTFDSVRRLVEAVEVIDDAVAVESLFWLLERTKQLVEPAGSCCLAAADRYRGRFTPDDRVVLLACGGNVSADDLADWHRRFIAPSATDPAEKT